MVLTDLMLWNRLMAFHCATPEAGGLVAAVMARFGDDAQTARRMIDHPEREAAQAFGPAYKRCFARYRAEFGHSPDGRIWPGPARPIVVPIAVVGAGLAVLGMGDVFQTGIFYTLGLGLGLVGAFVLFKNLKLPGDTRMLAMTGNNGARI